jgi:NADH-quinone oxidoreductase subunit M
MAAFAACGLPGFANFAGEVTVLFGAWKAFYPHNAIVVLACWAALVVGAIYMLRAIRNILHGKLTAPYTTVSDASTWRKIPFVMLLGCLLVFGFFPRLLTDKIKPAAQTVFTMATTGESRSSTEPNIALGAHE